MEEVRRPDDDELCGFVAPRDDGWHALTVFGATFGVHDSRAAAAGHVLDKGLAVLAERWRLRDPETGDWEIVCIQEANAARVTLALGYFTGPGVPIVTVTTDQLRDGTWELRL